MAALLLLSGLMIAQAPLVSVESLSETVVDSLVAHIPTGRPLALDVMGESSMHGLLWELTDALIARGDTVLVDVAPGAMLAQVRHSTQRETTGGNSLLARTLREITTHQIGLRVIDADTGAVTSVYDFELRTEKPLRDELQTMRWYDPVAMSLVLGGMIYLFYYGSE